jgi:hypothetical protein
MPRDILYFLRKRVGVCLLLLLLLSAFLFSVVLEVYARAGNNLLVDSFEGYQAGSSPSVGGWGMMWGDEGDKYQAMSSAYFYLLHKSLQSWRGEVMSSEQALTRPYRMLGRTVGNVIQQATVLSVDVWTNKGGQGRGNLDGGRYNIGEPITLYCSININVDNMKIVIIMPDGSERVVLDRNNVPAGTYSISGVAGEAAGERKVICKAAAGEQRSYDEVRFVVQQQQVGEILVIARYVDGVLAPNADVYVDGQYMGRTDVSGQLLVSGLPEGYHTVLVKQSILQGRGIYSSDEIRVYVRAGQRVDVDTVLKPVTPSPIITYALASPSNPKPGDRVTVTIRYVFLHVCSVCCVVKANAFGDWAKTTQLGIVHDGCEGQFHTEIEKSFSFTLPTTISPGRHYIRVGFAYAYEFARSYDELAQTTHVDIPIDVQTVTPVCEGDLWTDRGGQGHNVDDGTYRLFEPITFYFRSTCRLCNPFLVVVGPYGRFNFSLTGCFEPDRTYQLPPIYFNEERDVGEWTIIMYATPEGADHPIEVDRLRIWIISQTTTACELEITSVTFIDKETRREINPPINVGQKFSVVVKVRNVGSSSICISMSELNVDWSPRDLLEDHPLLCGIPPRELKPGEEAAVFYCGYFKALKPGYVTLRLKARGCPGYTQAGETVCGCSSNNYCEAVKEVTLEIISGGVVTTTIYTTITTTTTSTIHATATSWSTTYTTASATTYTTSTRTWYTTTTYTTTSTITSWVTTTVTARASVSYEKITQLSFIALTILTIPSLVIRAKKLRRSGEVEHQ